MQTTREQHEFSAMTAPRRLPGFPLRPLLIAMTASVVLALGCWGNTASAQDSWTYDIFVNECRKAGGTAGSTREQYMRGERFVCNQSGSGQSGSGPGSACEREAKINVDWVLFQDRGAQNRFAEVRRSGKSAFDSLLAAQGHNRNAQDTLLRCRGWVEAYLQKVGAGGGGGNNPQGGRSPGSGDCKCISVQPTGDTDFNGRPGYRVTNACPRMDVSVQFTDESLSLASASAWANAGSLAPGEASVVRAPGSYRLPSLNALGLRNDAGSYTCRCRAAVCY